MHKTPRWRHLTDASTIEKTEVFSGGHGNYIGMDGLRHRNTDRDDFNDWMNSQGIWFYDSQVHEDTHGRQYIFDVDGPLEKQARSLSKICMYQVGDLSPGVVSAMEMVRDAERGVPMIIRFTGRFSNIGKPLFLPLGLAEDPTVPTLLGRRKAKLPPGTKAHLDEYKKSGNQARQEILAFLEGMPNVRITKSFAQTQTAFRELFASFTQTA